MIGWKNASNTPPINKGDEQMTDRLTMWVVFKGEDIEDGRAHFGAYNFISETFFAVENDIFKKLSTGKAEVTHWDYINTPED